MGFKKNDGMSKNELITKLDAISVLYKNTLAIKKKAAEFKPKDSYKRNVDLPEFPGEYNSDADREAFKKAIDHRTDDAVSEMGRVYDYVYQPKKPEEVKMRKCPEPENNLVNDLKKKHGWKILVAGFVAICSLISGGLFSGDAITVIANIVILAACGFVGFRFYKNYRSAKAGDTEAAKLTLESYEKEKAENEEKYEQDMKNYQSAMNSHDLKKADFMEEYTAWRKVYLSYATEEAEIAEKLEADRVAGVKRIFDEEYLPAENKLNEYNDIVSEEYLPALGDITGLLKSGRADDFKEAVNLYEDLCYREKQLQLEREKEEQRKREEALKREAEERHHREQMKFQEEQERQRAREIKKQQDLEKQRLDEEKRHNLANEKQKQAEAKASRQKRCSFCAHFSTCRMRDFESAYNCTGFTPR